MDWFLYNNGLRHERLKEGIKKLSLKLPTEGALSGLRSFLATESHLKMTKYSTLIALAVLKIFFS